MKILAVLAGFMLLLGVASAELKITMDETAYHILAKLDIFYRE